MLFDFEINLHTNAIQKVGHYSRAEEREATREEVLLWQRTRELEKLLDTLCPPDVLALIQKIPQDVEKVVLNPEDFADIRRHAQHRVKMEEGPMNRERILGSLPVMRDGAPSCVWIAVAREIPRGEVQVSV
jgi:hypothetical protein